MASIGEVGAILIAAILATVVAVWGIITQRVVTRRLATLEHFSRLDNDLDQSKARQTFSKVTSDGCDLMTYAEPEKYYSDEAVALRLILNENERLAIGVQFGILDREFVRRICRGVIIRDWELSAPFFYKLRSSTGSQIIYHEFEELARAFSDNKLPRRSYHWRLWF